MIGPVHVLSDPRTGRGLVEQALDAARGGAWAFQLRDKDADDSTLVETARKIQACLAPFGTRLIINDRVDVACEVRAHGLHIGQGDGDPVAIRHRIGRDMLLGLSIENDRQARAMPAGIVDYIGAGPVRATRSKPGHAPAIGFAGLSRIVEVIASACPVIAIGGLEAGDVPQLKKLGVAGLAVISAVSSAPSPEAATRALHACWSSDDT